MNCKISKSQYNTDHQISRSQHFVDQDISRSRYFLGQRRLKALFRLRVETKWKKSLENNYWKYILAVMYTLIASQKNEISFQKLWWYINKTNEFSVVICVKKVKHFHRTDLRFSLPDIKRGIEMYAFDRFGSYFGLTAEVELWRVCAKHVIKFSIECRKIDNRERE